MNIAKSTRKVTSKSTLMRTPQSAERRGKFAKSFSLFIISILKEYVIKGVFTPTKGRKNK